MKNLQLIAVLCALGFAVITSPAQAADKAIPATPATPAQTDVKPVTPADPATPAVPPTAGSTTSSTDPSSDSVASGDTTSDGGKPVTPGPQVSDEIKKMRDEAAKARAEFLKKQQDLRGGLRGADRDARESIRAQLRQNREDFLNQQKDARQEFRTALAKLKESLKDHQTAVDDAKTEAKEKAGHARKDD